MCSVSYQYRILRMWYRYRFDVNNLVSAHLYPILGNYANAARRCAYMMRCCRVPDISNDCCCWRWRWWWCKSVWRHCSSSWASAHQHWLMFNDKVSTRSIAIYSEKLNAFSSSLACILTIELSLKIMRYCYDAEQVRRLYDFIILNVTLPYYFRLSSSS